MLGGLGLWAFHFLGVYAIASLGDTVARADDPAWRGAVLGFSAACILAGAVLAGLLWRADRNAADAPAHFRLKLGLFGALVAVVAMTWQAAPGLVGH